MATTFVRGKKRITIGVVALLSLAGAGAAFAYWTAQGTGVGEAQTGESVDFTITAEAPVGTLAPGNAGQTVEFTVDNPGTSAQYLTDVTVTIAGPDGTPWVPTGNCEPDDYTATMTVEPAAGNIAAGGTSEVGTVTVTLRNTAADQDDCQGQTVPLYFVAT